MNSPKAVIDATAVYLEAEDAMAAWIGDRCDLGANHWETIAKLFASWKAWAELAGEFVGSRKQFGEKLEARGLSQARKNHNTVRAYQGIRLVEAEPAPYWQRD